jgi:hypothetical protein
LFFVQSVSAVPGCTVNSGSTLFCKQKHNHGLFVELDVFDAFLSQVDKNVDKTSSPYKRGGEHSLGVKSMVPALIFPWLFGHAVASNRSMRDNLFNVQAMIRFLLAILA